MIALSWGFSMFSRKLTSVRVHSISLVLTLSFVLFSCSGEDKPSQSAPVIEMKDSQCLRKVDESLAGYFDGKLSDAKVNRFWDCMENAFQMFMRHTKGREIGLYHAKELRNFLHTFFLGDIRMTDGLLKELMQIKRVFLGGSTDYVTYEELDYTLKLFEGFRQLTLDLLPHIRLLTGEFYHFQKSYSTEDLDQSLSVLSQTMDKFALLIENSGQSYDFKNFENLLEEVYQLINVKGGKGGKGANGEKGGKKLRLVQELVPILGEFKNSLVGSPLESILPGQWKTSATILSEIFGLWMRYEHFSFHRGWSKDAEKLEAAFRSMYDSTQRLGLVISGTDKDLEWSKLERIVDDLDLVVGKYRGNSPMGAVKQYLPFIGELKAQLVGGEKNRVAAVEWPVLMRRLTQLAEVGLRWNHLVMPLGWSEGPGLDHLDYSVQLALKLVDEAINQHKEKEISIADLESLFVTAEASKLLPLGLTAQSINQTLPVFLNKILNDRSQEQTSRSGRGLDSAHLNYISKQWRDWSRAQKFINASSKGTPFDPQGDSILLEMSNLMDSPWPLVTDAEGRLIFRSKAEISWNQSSLTQLNGVRSLLRLLILGYAEDESRRQDARGVSRDELASVAEDIFPLAVDIGLFSPEDPNIWERIFIESDLFMPRSNGDEIVNLVEGAEYFAFVLSGIKAGENFLRLVPPECLQSIGKEERVLTSCYREILSLKRGEVLAHLPKLVDFSRQLNSKQWDTLVEYLETAVRGPEGADGATPIKTSDIKELLVLAQYLETFFLRFSKDGDFWHISKEEALVAFPIYDLPLLSLLGFADREDREALFAYMMKNCQPPPQTIEGLEELQKWKNQKDQWEFQADRVCLTHVLSELAKSL